MRTVSTALGDVLQHGLHAMASAVCLGTTMAASFGSIWAISWRPEVAPLQPAPKRNTSWQVGPVLAARNLPRIGVGPSQGAGAGPPGDAITNARRRCG